MSKTTEYYESKLSKMSLPNDVCNLCAFGFSSDKPAQQLRLSTLSPSVCTECYLKERVICARINSDAIEDRKLKNKETERLRVYRHLYRLWVSDLELHEIEI